MTKTFNLNETRLLCVLKRQDVKMYQPKQCSKIAYVQMVQLESLMKPA